MKTKEQYTLTYFNARGGGEIVRLIFAAAGITFTDNRLEKEQWLKIKPEMPMKNIPVLTVTEDEKSTTYCQSGAIARYLSKKFGLYGTTVEEDLLIEEVYDCVGDIRSMFVQRHFNTDAKIKEQLFEKITKISLPNLCSYIKNRKAKFGSDVFIIGRKLSLADLAVFNLVDGCVELEMGSLFYPFPDLLKHREDILEIDNIKQWIQTRPKTDV